jgi:hypothetical protein
LLVDHLLVDGAHELVLLLQILSDVIYLLPKLARHLAYHLLIVCLKLLLLLFLVIVPGVIRAAFNAAPILFAVDLHDVVDYVEVVVYRIASREDILRGDRWLLRMGARGLRGRVCVGLVFIGPALFEVVVGHGVLRIVPAFVSPVVGMTILHILLRYIGLVLLEG